MPPKITHCTISALPKSLFDPMPEVTVTFEGGETKMLFSYYPDEISFTTQEFIGLTEDEARQLRHKKDVRFLQS